MKEKSKRSRAVVESSLTCSNFGHGAEADFCVTLGGDGTVLHLTSLFIADEPLPPVVAFAMGTLGEPFAEQPPPPSPPLPPPSSRTGGLHAPFHYCAGIRSW